MPEISVIVPVYKVEPYLYCCIDSILAQTFTDFELILVDDGSPDRSGEICDEYALKDDKLIVVHKTNGGVSSARNIASLYAMGEYITFIDSDDWVEGDMLREMYQAIKLNQADLAVCGYRHLDLKFNTLESYTPTNGIKTNIEALEYYAEISNSVIHTPWNKLVKRRIVLSNPFPIDRRYSEDLATVYKWIYYSNAVVSVNGVFYDYYDSETGISRNNVPWLENLITFDEALEFCRIHGLEKSERLFAKKRIECDYWAHEQTTDNKIKKELREDFKKYLRRYGFSIFYNRFSFHKHLMDNLKHSITHLPNRLVMLIIGENSYDNIKQKLKH